MKLTGKELAAILQEARQDMRNHIVRELEHYASHVEGEAKDVLLWVAREFRDKVEPFGTKR